MYVFLFCFYLFVAVYFGLGGLVMHTQNFLSAVLFKVIPSLTGLVALFLLLHHIGFIVQVG